MTTTGRIIAAGLLLLALPPLALAAQAPAVAPGPYARIVTITPKPGQARAFEEGYERHLDWHRAKRDPWTWYGWSFVLGPRIGRFMDGTFGHAATDFDRAVDPAGDAADNAANVTPYADFTSHGVYRRLDEASRGAPLPDTSPYLVLATWRVTPGRAAEFERAIVEHARSTRATIAERVARATWYRLELGGAAPEYLLMQAAPTWAAAIAAGESLGSAPALPAGIVESVTTELLRYRPTHSYRP